MRYRLSRPRCTLTPRQPDGMPTRQAVPVVRPAGSRLPATRPTWLPRAGPVQVRALPGDRQAGALAEPGAAVPLN